MDRRNSSAIYSDQGSSPRDIHGSLPNVVDEELPSRSYYSSHIHIDPGIYLYIYMYMRTLRY
jgi:hypothetical protein